MERSDFRQYNELIDELRQHSSAYGNGPQRMAHYVMEALVSNLYRLPLKTELSPSLHCGHSAHVLRVSFVASLQFHFLLTLEGPRGPSSMFQMEGFKIT